MRNGIPCNEYHYTPKAKRDRISFRFVTDNGNTPAGCDVRIGDIDPMTGERITNLTLFREYYRIVDNQIYVHEKEIEGRLYMDGILNDEGESNLEKKAQFSVPSADPFDEPSDRILRLREIAESLTDRQKDIYEALLVQFSGGQVKITMSELADKWGVSVTAICKERDKIVKMIKEAIKS